MITGLETFAKVRTLHDRTDNPGERAAAASRMVALARTAGMTVAEALSKLDAAPIQPDPDVDWSAFAEAFWRAEAETAAEREAAEKAASAPEAPSRRWGLPIYDPGKIEPWRSIALHCVGIDWLVPKALGGRFLTKDERARLKGVSQATVTNATADWIETVLARCHTIQRAWRDRNGSAGAGARVLTPAARKRLDNCLILAKQGATPGERAAGKAAAERIAASAGLTLAEAQAQARGAFAGFSTAFTSGPVGWPHRPQAKPRKPTVADRVREKAEDDVLRRRRADAADRKFEKEHADQFAWAAEAKAAQAERDRAWAASRATAGATGAHP